MDLPHASLLGRPQIPVSVIIRCKPAKTMTVENTVRTRKTRRYSRPLGSPWSCLKRSYVHVPGVTATGVLVHRGDGQAGPTGWVRGAGWVYRVGNTGPGTYPATLPGEQTHQRSGPRSPCRGRSGWVGAAGAPGMTHPSGPVGPASWPSLVIPSRFPVKRPCKQQNGEISSILY